MAEIIRAENSGFCFGVKQAIEKTEQQIYNNKDKKIYTCGPLIHNQFVIDHLASQGLVSSMSQSRPIGVMWSSSDPTARRNAF